ncbi:hypothetical protein [Methylobacterium sp. J-092]|jgi:hypothetical protein|uniref:hypothetical protein n=1 Tax=Methylobacterium sp. J-092 TaxID=2836667 RepID=UPI001FB86D1B|nr:hypothetical protein [Methylobacterium sp. J-092]MCJ2006056.1 hypothetical protein [Methylobacterium sp. J-092]
MDAEHPEHLPIGSAAFTYAGCVGGDLSTGKAVLTVYVRADVVVATAQRDSALKPRLAGDALTAHTWVSIGTAIGDDDAVPIAKPEIEVNGVRGKNDP